MCVLSIKKCPYSGIKYVVNGNLFNDSRKF